jgi:hypothetical protein
MAAKPFTRLLGTPVSAPFTDRFKGSNEGWPVWELRNDPRWLLLSNS